MSCLELYQVFLLGNFSTSCFLKRSLDTAADALLRHQYLCIRSKLKYGFFETVIVLASLFLKNHMSKHCPYHRQWWFNNGDLLYFASQKYIDLDVKRHIKISITASCEQNYSCDAGEGVPLLGLLTVDFQIE